MFKEWLRTWLYDEDYIKSVIEHQIRFHPLMEERVKACISELFESSEDILDNTRNNYYDVARRGRIAEKLRSLVFRYLDHERGTEQAASIKAINDLVASEEFIDDIIRRIKKKQIY